MSISTWRQFPFFEGTPIKDPYYGSEADALYSDPALTAISNAGDFIAIATYKSTVKLINNEFNKRLEFQCYEEGWTINKMTFFEPHKQKSRPLRQQSSFLVTIAERQGYPVSLKLWDLKKLLDPKFNFKAFDFNSSFHTKCDISNGPNNYPMTCFANSNDYSILSFGFANGSVILVRGDILHDKGYRQRLIYESKDPITSIHFKDDQTLFVTTISKIFTLSTLGQNNGKIDKMIDDKNGADVDCTDIQITISSGTTSTNLLVAREDCFQFYNMRGKTHSLQMKVRKRNVFIYKNRYLLFLTHLESDLSYASDFTNNKLMVLDLKNNFIVFNQSFSGEIKDIFAVWNDLYVLLTDGSLLRLHEKSLHDNVEILVNNEIFPIALKLVNENPKEFEVNEILNLKKKYGFYLYDKSEYSESIKQFIECIPLGKTSEIISKFKESSKIQYLIEYIQSMVELKLTNDSHINLLLTSFTKLKMMDDFNAFIEGIMIDEDYEIIDAEKHKSFDLNMIIDLCKENENYESALLIAEKFNLPSKIVSIQLNEIKNYFHAFEYIKSLNVNDLLGVLIENINDLLNRLPNETTQILIDVFTGQYKPAVKKSLDVLDSLVNNNDNKLYNYPLLTSYQQFVSFMNPKSADHETNSVTSGDIQTNIDLPQEAPTYQPPRPRIIFSSFVNHDYEFVIFLEACIESYDKFGGNIQDKNDLLNTLYEMYLTVSIKSDQDESQRKSWLEKASKLLKDRKDWTESDKVTILMISNIYKFSEGEMIIRELKENTDSLMEGFELDLFRASMFADDIIKSFEIVKDYGEKEPELFRLSLTMYTSNDYYMEKLGDERIKELLEIIEQKDIMTPLEVLDCILANENNKSHLANVKLGLVKEYLLRNIKKQKQGIINNEKLMKDYENTKNELKENINGLLNDPTIINSTKCSVCNNKLDFPIIFFRCGHHVHENCVIEINSHNILDNSEDGDMKCPICSNDHDALKALRKQRNEVKLLQESFDSSLNLSKDKFKAMFNFLGRGGMESSSQIVD